MKNMMTKTALILALTATLTVTSAYAETVDAQNDQAPMKSSHPGLIQHMVFFRYKKSVTAEQRAEVAQKFLALREECKINGKPYIVSIDTGVANSKELADQNMDQGFLVTFKSVKDRDYYVGQPFGGAPYPARYEIAHDEFKKFLGASGYLDDQQPNPVFVFDFTAR